MDSYESAFEDLKKYLGVPPLLSRRRTGELLYMHLSISPDAISFVLVREDVGIQKPIYYTNKLLRDVGTKYTKAEKMMYALLTTSKQLWPYFPSHTIVVLIDQSLKYILQRPNMQG